MKRVFVYFLFVFSMILNAETYCGSTCKVITESDTNLPTHDLSCTLPAMPTFTITAENVLDGSGKLLVPQLQLWNDLKEIALYLG